MFLGAFSLHFPSQCGTNTYRSGLVGGDKKSSMSSSLLTLSFTGVLVSSFMRLSAVGDGVVWTYVMFSRLQCTVQSPGALSWYKDTVSILILAVYTDAVPSPLRVVIVSVVRRKG